MGGGSSWELEFLGAFINTRMVLKKTKNKKKHQEAHGPHRSPEKPVYINDYIIKFTCIISFYLIFENWMVHICKPYIPFTQGCVVPKLLKTGPVILEEMLKTKPIYFCYVVSISLCKSLCGPSFEQTWNPIIQGSPIEKGHGPSFEQTWIYFTQGWNWLISSSNFKGRIVAYFYGESPL